MQLSPPFRRAIPEDAQAMAELVNMAGDGLPLYLWSKMAEPGEDAWEVGRRRARRDSGSFSYVNTVMLEQKGRPVACLIGYRLPDAPEPIDYEKMPAMFVGMQELENLAPKTWYVNVVATYPELRGKGLGTSLLSLAEDIAIDTGASGHEHHRRGFERRRPQALRANRLSRSGDAEGGQGELEKSDGKLGLACEGLLTGTVPL